MKPDASHKRQIARWRLQGVRSPWLVAVVLGLLLLPAAASACEPRTRGFDNVPPTADFTWTPNPVQAGDKVFAIDLSEDPDGKIVQWHWDGPFGGGADLRSPNATIRQPGDYEVKLTVWDDCGDHSEVTKVVHVGSSPPRASFTFRPLHPTTADTVQFLDHSSDIDGTIRERVWLTSGGVKSSSINPVYNFHEAGIYEVTLIVTDNDGLQDSQVQTIAVAPRVFLHPDFQDEGIPAPPLLPVLLVMLGILRLRRSRHV